MRCPVGIFGFEGICIKKKRKNNTKGSFLVFEPINITRNFLTENPSPTKKMSTEASMEEIKQEVFKIFEFEQSGRSINIIFFDNLAYQNFYSCSRRIIIY